MTERFSRSKILAILEHAMSNLEKEYGFKQGDGYNVVTGKGDATNRAFGAYDAYRDLVEDILS